MPSPPDLTGLPSGTMLEGPPWDKPVRLLGAKNKGDVMFLDLDGMGTKMYGPGQLDGVRVVEPTYGKPWKAHAYVSILRHELARSLGMAGNADPLPHQLESIYHISGIPGPIRFLLADEPGAGKTAVASRIIQELMLQRRVKKVLVVVPAQLKTQWESEMAKFANITGHIVQGSVSGNPWISDHSVLITSMDFAKLRLDTLGQAEFDLVVVDEAHNLNATAKKATDRYRLGETLSGISKHMVFLTATPHRGKTENFRLLLKLLEPAEFSDPDMKDAEISAKKRRLFLRHIKEGMKGMNDEKLFKGRSVTSLTYHMSDEEGRMYRAVTSYVGRQLEASKASGNRMAGFAVLLIQKRMASSTHSLLKTLQRRREKMTARRDDQTDYRDLDDVYDLDDRDKMAKEEYLEGVTASRTDDELREELVELDGLIEAARIAAETKPDTKLESLLGEMRNLGDDGQLLVFSEYRDTLDYLDANIRKAGLDGGGICRIDGTMDMPARQLEQDDFNAGRRRIMLATDAAREGINLQYRCHRMVNYDLPWSPIALEQRMGRLHRYGQKKDVTVYNLVASDMMEGDVLVRLFDKLEKIGEHYKTFDVRGTVLTDINMGAILEEIVRHGRTVDVEGSIEEAARRADSADQMLARTPVDMEFVRSRMEKIGRQMTDGPHLVEAIRRILSGMGGSMVESRDGGETVLKVPGVLVGGPLGRRRVTLPGKPAEALARGGAAYRHIADWVLENCSDDLGNGSVFVDDSGRDGWVAFHEVSVTDGRSNEAARLLLAHFTDGADGSNAVEVEPHILDGMSYDDDMKPDSGFDGGDAMVGHVFRAAQGEVDEMVAGRKAFWKTRSEVGRKGLERQMDDIEVKQSGMSVMDPEHARLEDERLELKNKLKALDDKAMRETRLSLGKPRMLGWVRVVQAGRTKTDTEMLGMKACMAYERENGFEPKDVHEKRGIGHDIESRHPDGRVHKIEVKARCDTSGLEVTAAEKHHLETDPDALLFVLWNAGSDDERAEMYDRSRLGFVEQKVWRVKISGP